MFELERYKNLPAIPTQELEGALFVITNKEFKEAVCNELISRNDLTNFKVINVGGNSKKEIILHFDNKDVMTYMVEKNLPVWNFLDKSEIEKLYGTVLPKELFNVEIIEVIKKPTKYLKKV